MRTFNVVVKIENDIAYLKHPSDKHPEIFMIDLEDLDRVLNACCWKVEVRKDRPSEKPYVRGHFGGSKKSLHQFVTNFKWAMIDHINRNTLDNRKSNLRETDSRRNRINSDDLDYFKHSKYIGIYFNASKQLWRAQTVLNNKNKDIWTGKSEMFAALKYDDFQLSLGVTDYLNITTRKISEQEILEFQQGAYRYRFPHIYAFFHKRN